MQDIEIHFRSEPWFPVGKIDRSFVKHTHSNSSPGKIWHYRPDQASILLSVVIPTIDADRGGYFLKLLSQIGCQSLKDYEVIVVRGDPRQGRAINTAAALALGKYILTLDDDTSLPDPKTFCKLVCNYNIPFEVR